MAENSTLAASLMDVLDQIRPLDDLPTHLVVNPATDLSILTEKFPKGELSGIKIIHSPYVDVGICYFVNTSSINSPPREDGKPHYVVVRPESAVKMVDV